MIARHWNALLKKEFLSTYTQHLTELVDSELRQIKGFQSLEIHGSEQEDYIKVIVITYWENIECIESFAGNDMLTAVVPDKVKNWCIDFDRNVMHYEMVSVK